MAPLGSLARQHWPFRGAEGVSKATVQPHFPAARSLPVVGHGPPGLSWGWEDAARPTAASQCPAGGHWAYAGASSPRRRLLLPVLPSSPLPLLPPTEPRKEPLVCCVSCSSSEFYSAPLTLADRPQGRGQKDNCLQQFCPQLVSPSACRAAQPARHCLTDSIKFNSRCCEGGCGGNETFGGRFFPFHPQNLKLW